MLAGCTFALALLIGTGPAELAATRQVRSARSGLEEQAWLARNAIQLPLQAGSPALAQLARDASVIGLGEATHGTSEFFEVKASLIRQLVEEQGVEIIAFETDYATALPADRYAAGADGTSASAALGSFLGWYQVPAVVELLDWVRSFNQRTDRKVRFIGIDVPQFDVSPSLRMIEAALSSIGDPFASQVPKRASCFARDASWRSRRDVLAGRYAASPQAFRTACASSLRSIVSHLESQRSSFTRAGRSLAYYEAMMLGRNLVKVERQFDAAPVIRRRDEFEGREQQIAKLSRWRDTAMADTLLTVMGANRRKAVVWAHNGHVSRVVGEPASMATSLGAILQERLGSAYRPVALTFGRGTFAAFDQTPGSSTAGSIRIFEVPGPRPGSFEALLDQIPGDHVMIDLRGAPSGLRRPLELVTVGGGHDPSVPDALVTRLSVPSAFDAIIHVRRAEAQQNLSR